MTMPKWHPSALKENPNSFILSFDEVNGRMQLSQHAKIIRNHVPQIDW